MRWADERDEKDQRTANLPSPMAKLYTLTVEVAAITWTECRKAEKKVGETCWCISDTVELASPFIDMRELFYKLHSKGIKIAIATADDREPTQEPYSGLLTSKNISSPWHARTIITTKPAPDMVHAILPAHEYPTVKSDGRGRHYRGLENGAGCRSRVGRGCTSVSHARDLVPLRMC
ncbi:MAG: HAD family hydrolase [Anaerolineales bacterium]|nr:HAD family hydrolase [Anaerolineales bacterium]